MILAVTGITGHTGSFFLKELERHQFMGTVRCLIRESSKSNALDESNLSIEKIIGDNTDRKALLKLTEGADIIVHIYNIRHSLSVLEAAIKNHVRRIVMVHTTGIYSKYKMASEEYKKIEAEVDKILISHDIDVTILRPTMIFGDICDHNIHNFIEMVDKYPILPEINRGTGKIRPVNARDLAKAYYTVCMTNNLPKLRYDLSGERSLSLHELFDTIGEYLGKKVKFINCPMWLASFGARCVKAVSLGKIDFVEKVLRMGEDRDYGHEDATRDFGYTTELFNEGLKREVDQFLERKKK